MPKYVDADLLAREIKKIGENELYKRMWGSCAIWSMLVEHSPDGNAVEVVRCKDCKHFENAKVGYTCNIPEGMIEPIENGFCSYGERKDEGGEVYRR